MAKIKYEHTSSDAREAAFIAQRQALRAAEALGEALRFGGTTSPVGASFKARLDTARAEINDAQEWICRGLALREIEQEKYETENDN